MTQGRIYMDFNATAPLRPPAREAVLEALLVGGNPSSIHAEGRRARAGVEAARCAVATLVKGLPRNVVFTSGGTEALNLALTPTMARAGDEQPLDHLLISATEHACVLKGHRFPAGRTTIVPVLTSGVLDLGALDEALDRGQRCMLALQLANNETGVIHPVREAADRVHRRGGFVVCDAVQAAGKIAIKMQDLGADVLALSAHKFGGPPGTGALVFAAEDSHIGDVVLRGGGQERGARAGTENVAAIAGFGAAAAAAAGDLGQEMARLRALRDDLEARLKAVAPDIVVFGDSLERLPNTVTFAVPGLRAETVLMGLDLGGVAVSSGSACSSGKVGRSHVLQAMGVAEPLIAGGIRLSLGWSSTADDVAGFADVFERLLRGPARQRAA